MQPGTLAELAEGVVTLHVRLGMHAVGKRAPFGPGLAWLAADLFVSFPVLFLALAGTIFGECTLGTPLQGDLGG